MYRNGDYAKRSRRPEGFHQRHPSAAIRLAFDILPRRTRARRKTRSRLPRGQVRIDKTRAFFSRLC